MSMLGSARVPARRIVTVGFLALFAGYASADTRETIQTAAGEIVVETKAAGLQQPWSLAFLPDGRMLVSERPGRLRVVKREGVLSPPVEGALPVYTIPGRQPGLLDIALDRDYAHNQTIYFCRTPPAGTE
jgi:glucose/arabinose dehydrogenase